MRLAYKGIDALTMHFATCKMVEQKNVSSSCPTETAKSQLAAPQPSTGESWNLPKKDTSHLRVRSSEGRQKAFSTCASHMMAVTVFYGTLLFMYLQPRTNHSLDNDKMASVFYTLVIPMLNPLIYSLRNKDVKDALKRFLDNSCQSFRLMQI